MKKFTFKLKHESLGTFYKIVKSNNLEEAMEIIEKFIKKNNEIIEFPILVEEVKFRAYKENSGIIDYF